MVWVSQQSGSDQSRQCCHQSVTQQVPHGTCEFRTSLCWFRTISQLMIFYRLTSFSSDLTSNESSSELTNSSNECLSNGADVCLLHSGS